MSDELARFGISLPARPTLDDLVRAVEDRVRARIAVRRFSSLIGTNPNGIVLPFPRSFLVGHGPSASEITRTIIIGHELGHIIHGHVSVPAPNTEGTPLRCRPLTQNGKDCPKEREAEQFSFSAVRVLLPARSFIGLERFIA